MSQLAVLTRRWCPSQMKLEQFREVVLESSSVDELKERVCGHLLGNGKDFSVNSSANELFCFRS